MHLGVAERAGDKPRTYRLKDTAGTTAKPPVPPPPPAPTPPVAPPGSALTQEIDRLRAKFLTDPNQWAHEKLANDGGPGLVMMSHNSTVRQIGHMLAGELDRRVQARLADGPGNQDWAKEARLEARANTAFDKYAAQQSTAADAAARARGFASAEDMRQHWRDARAGSPEELRLMNLMEDVNQAADKASAKYLAAWGKLKDQRDQLHHELTNTAQRTRTIQREEAIKLLAEVRGDSFGGPGLTWQGRYRYTEVPSKPNPKGLEAMRFAESNYPQGWLELARQNAGRDGYSLIYPVQRGDYSDGTKTARLSDGPPTVGGDPGSGRVATHELGHAMEKAVPGLLQLEQAEIWRRTSKGPIGERLIDDPKPMHGYTGEYARADQFPLAYSGKDYSNGGLGADFYELFTTGVESLFNGSPYLDPSFRAWMLGVMATLGRDVPVSRQ